MYAWIQKKVNLLQTGPEFGGMPIGQGGGVTIDGLWGLLLGETCISGGGGDAITNAKRVVLQ